MDAFKKSQHIQLVFPVAVNYTFPGYMGMISAFAYCICTPKLAAILGKGKGIYKLQVTIYNLGKVQSTKDEG